jgi:hypothetical protein
MNCDLRRSRRIARLKLYAVAILAVVFAVYARRVYQTQRAAHCLRSEEVAMKSWRAGSGGRTWGDAGLSVEIRPLFLITPRDIAIHKTTMNPEAVASAIETLSADELYLSPTDSPVQAGLLRKLADYGGLSSLDVNGTIIDSTGWQEIGRMKSLKRLFLNGTNINSQWVDCLKGKELLEVLALDQTNVDDACIEVLISLKMLKKLYLGDTAISAAGFNRIRSELPHVVVYGRPRGDRGR